MGYCKEHPDLVALCTNCKHPECPDGRCKQYRLLEKRIREDRIKKQELERMGYRGTPGMLIKVTTAIKALDDMLSDENCGTVYSPLRVTKFRDALVDARNNAFGHLIDWKHIARGMKQ